MGENLLKASVLRSESRLSLAGQWLSVAGFVLVWWLIQTCISMVPVLGTIVSIIVTGPFMLGLMLNMRRVSHGEASDFNHLVIGFNDFARSCCVYLIITAMIVGVMLLGAILFAAVFGIGYFLTSINSVLGDGFIIFASVLFGFICVIGIVYIQMRYAMVYFILADMKEIGAWEALKLSSKIMKGNMCSFFYLSLSFLGWGLLCLLTLGIGFLFLFPYMLVSISKFYDRIIIAEG